MDAVVRSRIHLDLQHDLVDVIAHGFDIDVELNIEIRLDLPLKDLRSARTLDR